MNTVSVDECRRKLGTNLYFLARSNEQVPCALQESVKVYPKYVGATLVEVDICFLSNPSSNGYSAVAEGMATDRNDVVGALVTLFGRAMGLGLRTDVEAQTVMHATDFGSGNTLARYLYGDDIEGIRAIYGSDTAPLVHWRRRSPPSAWVAGAALPLSFPVGAADGAIGHPHLYESGYTGLAAFSLGAPGYISFASSPYPMTSSSVWSGTWFGTPYTSHQPPAVSVNSGSYWDANWALVWFGKLSTKDTCTVYGGNSLWSVYSEHAFSVYEPLGWTVTTPICSIHAPEVVFHQASNHFLAFYVNRDFANATANDRVYVRSAYAMPFERLYWSNAQALPLKALGPVSAACSGSGTCALTLLSANTAVPQPVMYAFTYSSATNTVTLGSASTQTYALQHRPTVAYRSTDAAFTYAEAYVSSGTWWDEHTGEMFSYSQSTVPFIGYSTLVGASTRHAPSLMEGADAGLAWQYLLYVP